MSTNRPPTAVVLLNLGGPADLEQVGGFLQRLFADREIIKLPLQRWLGPFIASRRTPKVKKLYAGIGGGSPILRWTEAQGRGMCERLDQLCPETAPHKFYVSFRYAPPFADDALRAMKADGVTRAIAFTQYPHFSCATTGSSLNDLWRAADRTGTADAFKWSVIDRWPLHDGFVEAMTDAVREGLARFSDAEREDTVILFSAHSLPVDVVDRGDAYPPEVAATVSAVMDRLGRKNEYLVCWQSAVGPVRWLGPATDATIRGLAARGVKRVLTVPIAFTSDHIETLSEIDIEYKELAHEVGLERFERAPALNDAPRFLDAMADIVKQHLESGAACSRQYSLRCPGCVNPYCRDLRNPIVPYERRPLPDALVER